MAEILALFNHLANDRTFDGAPRPCEGAKTKIDQRRRLDDQLSTIGRSRLDVYRSMRSLPA